MTPPPSDDILVGITRNLVMKLAEEELGMKVQERSIARTELYNSDEVFFSGTAMEVTAVVEADDRVIGNGEIGPVCTKLKESADIGMGRNPNTLICVIRSGKKVCIAIEQRMDSFIR